MDVGRLAIDVIEKSRASPFPCSSPFFFFASKSGRGQAHAGTLLTEPEIGLAERALQLSGGHLFLEEKGESFAFARRRK